MHFVILQSQAVDPVYSRCLLVNVPRTRLLGCTISVVHHYYVTAPVYHAIGFM